MAEEFVPQNIGKKDWDGPVLGTPHPNFDYIHRSTTGDADYPEESGPRYLQVNGKFDNLQVTANINATGTVAAQQLIVSGISTLGVTTVTNLTTQTLNVSGISTLGVTTVTNLTAQQLIVSGISTIGLGTTAVPPSNSQLSFFLLNDTTLRIAVKGTDGILRFSNITLA
jgi:hypothetical protein